MTNTIYDIVKSIDHKATIEPINRDVIIVSPLAIDMICHLRSIKEDCWLMSNNSIMINRR